MSNTKIKKIIRYTFLLGLFLVVLGTSYALFSMTLIGNKKTRIKTGDFSLRLTDKYGNEETSGYAINLENAYPTEDAVGIESQAYEFVVENNGNIPASYQLILNGSGDMNPEIIKYSLTQKDYLKKQDGTYYMGGLYKDSIKCYPSDYCTISANTLQNSSENILHTTTLLPGEKIGYELRLWMNWNATSLDITNKTFEANVVIKGTQAESIYEGSAGSYANYTFYKDGTLIINGNGPIETKVDNVEIDHGGPYLDIIAKYFEENGVPKSGINEISTFNEELVRSLTNNQNSIDGLSSSVNKYDFCSRLSSDEHSICATKARESMSTFPYRVTRVVLNEGITSLQDNEHLFTLTGDYMLTLPSTLEVLDDYNNFTDNFTGYDGYTLIIPPNITELGSTTNSLSTNTFYGKYLEYIDYNNVETINHSAIHHNAYNGIINIGNNVKTINGYGIIINSYTKNPTINIPNNVNEISYGAFFFNGEERATFNIDNTQTFVQNNWDSRWHSDIFPTPRINYLR